MEKKKYLLPDHERVNSSLSCSEQKQDNNADKKDAMAADLIRHECLSQGSDKQKRWAAYIITSAAEVLAVEILEGTKSYDEAAKIIANPSANYWINNRSKWGM